MSALVGFERAGERLLTVIDVGRAGLEDPGLEARKAWVPVSVQVLTRELAERLGAVDRTGVRITRVFGGSAQSGGPAASATSSSRSTAMPSKPRSLATPSFSRR